jgi:hypothetical protein
MTADRRAALVEKARIEALRVFNHEPGGTSPSAWWGAAIDLIRAEALEEAARVAEYRCGSPEWSNDTNSGYECAAKEIAADLRALKGTT